MKYTTMIAFFLHLQLSSSSQSNYAGFMESYAKKDYQACVDYGAVVVRSVNNPFLKYQLSQCLANSNKVDSALILLDELAKSGLPYNPTEIMSFSQIPINKRYFSILKQFRTNRKIYNNYQLGFELNDQTFIPEGITATKGYPTTFYIGSLAKSKILSVQNGIITTFADSSTTIGKILGVKISNNDSILWVCSVSQPTSQNKFCGIFGFDRFTRKLLFKKLTESDQENHFFNDLVETKDGTLFITDSKSGQLFQYRYKENELKELPHISLIYPNGIAYDSVANNIYIADYTGIKCFQIETSKISDMPSDYFTSGIDGLYFHKNSLIGIQNPGDDRIQIIRFTLNRDKLSIRNHSILQSHAPDFNIPTTGTIVDNRFYFIANSYLKHLSDDGIIKNREDLQEHRINFIQLKK